MIINFINKENRVKHKNIYKVIKKVDKNYKFKRDFVETKIDWEFYYPILTNNNYSNIWAYLCKKYKTQDVIDSL